MTWIGQYREQRFLVNQLRAKTVHHADRTCTISVEKRGVFTNDRQVLVHEQAFVNDVDLLARDAKAIVFEFKFLWRAYHRRVTGLFEELSKQLKLFDCRHAGKIDDRDTWWTFRLATEIFLIRTQQDLEHEAPAVHRAHVVINRKLFHHRQ